MTDYINRIPTYNFDMGQNNSREQWSSYDSQEFFKQQIQFYRWRADSISNTHICKVFFKLQETVRDRQKLKIFLNTKFTQNEYIPISQLMSLSNVSDKQAKQELMSFETYICQLSQLETSMPLPEVLYTLKVMFSGYQTLLNKLGRCRVDLNCCFVTMEGEVRVWINQDYKNNQLQLDSNTLVGKNCVISSQMALIRRCIEIAETLASNHTQFLHFSRQFRSYMERDMLQNWNFQNARKLINSYVYTYRINLPSNIKHLISKYIQITQQQSSLNSSRFQSQSSIAITSKDQLLSTGEQFIKQKCHSNQSSKKELGRPLSYSDYSNSKKSESIIHNPIKSHSKKFSSTDLKNQIDKNKSFESPKVSRSDLIQFKRKDENMKQSAHGQSSSIQTLKLRKQREYATAQHKNESKLYNFSTSVGFSPNMNNSTIQMQNKDYFSTQRQNGSNSILKKTQQTKQKKKLQKKVATISKYISYYQNEHDSRAQQNTYRQVIEQQAVNKSSSNGGYLKNNQYVLSQQSKHHISSPSNSIEFHNHSSNNSQNNFTKQFPIPYYQKSTIEQNKQKPSKGKSQKNQQNKSIYTSNESQDIAISNQPCFTIKTVNKLLQNNEVSLHESNGSFMSIQQSESSYQGVLNKMGRSVDVLKLPSNKHLNIQKKAFFANSMNRSQLLK